MLMGRLTNWLTNPTLCIGCIWSCCCLGQAAGETAWFASTAVESKGQCPLHETCPWEGVYPYSHFPSLKFQNVNEWLQYCCHHGFTRVLSMSGNTVNLVITDWGVYKSIPFRNGLFFRCVEIPWFVTWENVYFKIVRKKQHTQTILLIVALAIIDYSTSAAQNFQEPTLPLCCTLSKVCQQTNGFFGLFLLCLFFSLILLIWTLSQLMGKSARRILIKRDAYSRVVSPWGDKTYSMVSTKIWSDLIRALLLFQRK